MLFLLLYVLGFSKSFVAFFPQIYFFVADYGTLANNVERLKTGVRVDFAVFTLMLLWLVSFFTKLSAIKNDTFILRLFCYASASTIPFFMLGWGYYSNRYLFTAWFLILIMLLSFSFPLLVRYRISKIASMALIVIGLAWFTYQMASG